MSSLRTRVVALAGVAVLVAGAYVLTGQVDLAGPAEILEETEMLLLNGEAFRLEVARSERAISRGMMHRADVPPDRGMLFVFEREEMRGFWMANCLIDIDIAFITAAGRVTAVHTMIAEPPQRADESWEAYSARLPRYSSERPAQFVLEFRAGTLALLGLEPGSVVPLDFERIARGPSE